MRAPVLGGAWLLFLLAGCGGGVDSDAAARAAYLGLDDMVEEAMNLGFDGFNAATSANIPEQSAMGDESGTLVVTGQVDQGSSPNKEMRLRAALTDYQDVVLVEDELLVLVVTLPLEVETSPVEVDTLPVEVDTSPVEVETSPVEVEIDPVEVEVEVPPVEVVVETSTITSGVSPPVVVVELTITLPPPLDPEKKPPKKPPPPKPPPPEVLLPPIERDAPPPRTGAAAGSGGTGTGAIAWR